MSPVTDASGPELRRTIGVGRATAMVAGIIIGASIFVQPSQVTGQVPSATGVLAVWLGAGLLTMIGALVIAELASAWPKTGGVYVFLKRAYSPGVAFLWGWAMFWTMHTGIVAAIAMVFAKYVGSFVTLDEMQKRLVAIGAVVALSALNYVGVRYASAAQAILTAIKVLAIVAIIGIAFTMGGAAHAHAAAAPVASMPPLTLRAIVNAMIAGLFAFGGWHMVSYSAEETIDPVRTIPRSLILGTLTVTVLYVALNAAYLYVLPIAQVSASDRVAADLAGAISPGGGSAQLISALVILSTLGAANGVLLAGPRVYLAMANDGVLFRWLGTVHARFRTPHRAIVLQAAWAAVLIATNTFRALFTRVVYTEWVFFALLASALFFLRTRPDYSPVYRLRYHRLLAGLFVACSATIVVTQIVTDPKESITGLLLVLSGAPVYYLWTRQRNQPPRT